MLDIDNALDDERLNHPGWLEVLNDYMENEPAIRTLASTRLQICVIDK